MRDFIGNTTRGIFVHQKVKDNEKRLTDFKSTPPKANAIITDRFLFICPNIMKC